MRHEAMPPLTDEQRATYREAVRAMTLANIARGRSTMEIDDEGVVHIRHAVLDFAEASRLARGRSQLTSARAAEHARAACEHLVDAAALISPEAGQRVADAYLRAFDDAHCRTVERDADAHGLDEGGVASCAAEGTCLPVVDVCARAADDDGLHGANGSAEPSVCACAAPPSHVAWVDLATMRALEDSVAVCLRCGRALASGTVQ